MRYIFFLLLQLYIPCRASTQVASKPPRSRRRRMPGGVRGRTVRRLSSANIFSHNRNDDADPISAVPMSKALTFEARMMLKPKHLNKGGNTNTGTTNEGILDLPRKSTMIMRMGMGQSTKGNSQSSSVDNALLVLELTKSSTSESSSTTAKSQASGEPHVLPFDVSSPDSMSSAKGKGKSNQMGSKSTYFSQKSKLSKRSKSAKASKMSMNMDVMKPTKPPALVPTITPTAKPIIPQTLAPTIPPPTAAPATQTSAPTFSPTRMACMVDGAGDVGSTNGDVTLYDFFYQLEVVAGMTAEEVNDNLLKEVEVAMANALIPDLFPEQCGGGGRNLQSTDAPTMEGRYVGLSTRPPDFVLDGFTCSGNYIEPCYVVSAATTVYSVGLSQQQIQDDLDMGIQQIIQSERLVDQFDEIVGATLLDNNLDPVTPSPIPTTPQPTVTKTPVLTVAPTRRPSFAPTEAPTKGATPPPQGSLATPSPTTSTQPPAPPSTQTPAFPSTQTPTSATRAPSTTFIPTIAPSTENPTNTTRAPTEAPSEGDSYDGPPLFPLWAWTVLGVGLGLLCIICIYLNRREGHVNLEADDNDDKMNARYQTQSQYSTDDGDGYVPPSPGLVSPQPAPSQFEEPKLYLQSASQVQGQAVGAESYSDSGAADDQVVDSKIPTNIALDPGAEMESAEVEVEEEDQDELSGEEDDEEVSYEEDESYEDEDEEQVEFEEDEFEQEESEEEESEEESESEEQDQAEQSVLGEFQVVQVVGANMSFQTDEDSESESEEEGEEQEEEEGDDDDDEEEEDGEYEEEDEEENGGYYEEGEGEDTEVDETGEQIEVDMTEVNRIAQESQGEESQSSYDEETYAEGSYVEETLEESYHEELSQEENSYEEIEVLQDGSQGDEGEQSSWLQELQQAQAGHYPSY